VALQIIWHGPFARYLAPSVDSASQEINCLAGEAASELVRLPNSLQTIVPLAVQIHRFDPETPSQQMAKTHSFAVIGPCWMWNFFGSPGPW
jgi:hypothetical protein